MNNDKIKVCVFLGSPRKNGNSDILLSKAVNGIKDSGFEVALFKLNGLKIRGCQNCGNCENTGICTKHDDMDFIYEEIRKCNRFVLASPIFFFGLSAQSKLMVDRCQSFWCEKYLLNKTLPQEPVKRRGLLMLVGGMDKEIGHTCSEATAKAFFRTISVNEHVTLSFKKIDKKGEILNHPDALKKAYEAGKKLVIA